MRRERGRRGVLQGGRGRGGREGTSTKSGVGQVNIQTSFALQKEV
jgi:hypothetical protein